MGNIEREVRRRARRNEVRQIALATVKTAGLLAIALAAPKVVTAMRDMGLITTRRHPELIKRSYQRLIDSGFLAQTRGVLHLTQKGEAKLRELEYRSFRGMKPRRWDRKWRVLAFDIPNRRQGVRDRARLLLKGIGFRKLQNSVWVFPYDCEDLVTLLKADLGVGRDMLYMVVEAIEGEASLKKEFKIK